MTENKLVSVGQRHSKLLFILNVFSANHIIMIFSSVLLEENQMFLCQICANKLFFVQLLFLTNYSRSLLAKWTLITNMTSTTRTATIQYIRFQDVLNVFQGTDHIQVKIYLIGVFASLIALCSIFFNGFFTIVFITNQSVRLVLSWKIKSRINFRRSSVYYFGILAIIDAIMAVNYLAVMSLPVSSRTFKN